MVLSNSYRKRRITSRARRIEGVCLKRLRGINPNRRSSTAAIQAELESLKKMHLAGRASATNILFIDFLMRERERLVPEDPKAARYVRWLRSRLKISEPGGTRRLVKNVMSLKRRAKETRDPKLADALRCLEHDVALNVAFEEGRAPELGPISVKELKKRFKRHI
jgi:hypothetical protein